MTTIHRLDPNGRRSRAVVHCNTVYVGGQVADTKEAEIASQTSQALAKVEEVLAEVGSSKSKLLSVTIWLKTMDDYSKMNEVWDKWVDSENLPARCCGTAEMADPAYLFEITAIAAI